MNQNKLWHRAYSLSTSLLIIYLHCSDLDLFVGRYLWNKFETVFDYYTENSDIASKTIGAF